MTDLRDLLHAAAPLPSRPVNAEVVIAEAARRRPWRRIGLWLGSMAVVFGVGAGASGVLSPAGDDTAVDTRPAPRPAGVDHGRSEDGVVFEAIRRDGGGASRESSATTTTTPPWDPDEPWPPAEGKRAPNEGCHIVAGGTGVVTPQTGPLLATGAGNDDMNADRCRYVARRHGGYWGSGTWSVTIERGDDRHVYAHYNDAPPCAEHVIEPGDIVTVSVRTAGATAEGEVYAGPDVTCR